MQDLMFTPLPLEQLKMELSDDVVRKISSLIHTSHTSEKQDQLLTRKEAAKLLSVSLPTILDWTKKGKIIGYRLASRVRYKRSELEDALLRIKT